MTVRVFISSTSRDLGHYRQAAIQVCNQLELIPIAMEFFGSMSVGATEGSKQRVEDSDIYVGIFAHRYGYIEAGYDKSVTEIEFDYAGERQLDRFCFLVDPEYPWPTDAIDYQHQEQLKSFKDRINRTLIRSYFTTVDDFKAKLIATLADWRSKNVKDLQSAEHKQEKPVFIAPSPPALLFGRDDSMQDLKTRLGVSVTGTTERITIIRGWPGVGKTTLLMALVHDADVNAKFADGVLWAYIGEQADVGKQMRLWLEELGGYLSTELTLGDVIQQLSSILHDKKMLLIVDDVWHSDAAIPFKQIVGKQSALLVTTRFQDVAREVATKARDIYRLGALSTEAGAAMLQELTPEVYKQYTTELHNLVETFEGLPLALRVAARLLDSEYSLGFDISNLVTELSQSSVLLDEMSPEDRFDPHTGTTPTIRTLLAQSTNYLDDEEKEYFALLGTFAPKPATFELDDIKAVWDTENPKPKIVTLVNRGLLEPLPSTGHFWMHRVLVMHARQLANEL